MQVDRTNRERSLLLFLESCAVDKGGRVNVRHMNAEDMRLAEEWHAAGFIQFGRIASYNITNNSYTHWVALSDAAWVESGLLRAERGKRAWIQRQFQTTAEARSGCTAGLLKTDITEG